MVSASVYVFTSAEPKAPGELIGWLPTSSVVARRPHFRTGISLQSASRSQPNFICSMSLMGYFRNIPSELWLLWQLIGPIGLLWEMHVNSVASLFFVGCL